MQCQTCTCCGFFYTGSAKGELGGREAQGNAGVPSELSSFASDGVGGLRQEGRQNYEGQVCHRATDRKAKTGQANVGFQGDLHEDDDGRTSEVSVHAPTLGGVSSENAILVWKGGSARLSS